ncbi:sugar phosphate isomerase/epimerase, partial [Candidatus Bathyarchaeota archaeon]|nr:sugar phosphate isomerase/epimerase [Candidatus Bathyarchaeota archaeon]
VENVPEPYPFLLKSVEHFQKFYEEMDENVGLALDIGHANINGQIAAFIESFADKLTHIHAHDNCGESDEHLGIGCGTVNWKETIKLLRKIGYDGIMVVESISHVHESVDNLRKLLV